MKKRVLVTGASGGLGRVIAERLCHDGYTLALHYRRDLKSVQTTAKTLKKSGGRATLVNFDVTNREQTRQNLEADIQKHGAYWGVVCSSGVIADGPFPALSGDDWDRVLRTNLDAFYNTLRPLVMPMIRLKNGGRIVTLSSLSGQAGNRGQVNYSAAEAGIIGATKALSKELAKRDITVNSVAPGLIDTAMVTDELRDAMLPAIPMRRLGKPSEVAATVSFLFSEGAGYITGQVISVNGGIF